MKAVKLFIISGLFTILSFSAGAQTPQIEKLYEKYSSVEGITAVKIGKAMIEVTKLTTKHLPKEVESMTVLVMVDMPNVKKSVKSKFIDDINNAVKDMKFITGGKQKGMDAEVFAESVNETDGKLKNIVVRVSNDQVITVVEMIGEFDPDHDFTKM